MKVKKTKDRRIPAILMSSLLVLTLFPVNVLAEEGAIVDEQDNAAEINENDVTEETSETIEEETNSDTEEETLEEAEETVEEEQIVEEEPSETTTEEVEETPAVEETKNDTQEVTDTTEEPAVASLDDEVELAQEGESGSIEQKDAVELDEFTKLPKKINIEDLDSLNKIGKLEVDANNRNWYEYENSKSMLLKRWISKYDYSDTDISYINSFYVLEPKESGLYHFHGTTYGIYNGYGGLYDKNGNLSQTAEFYEFQTTDNYSMYAFLEKGKKYVFGLNTHDTPLSSGDTSKYSVTVEPKSLGDVVSTTFEINCEVDSPKAGDEFYCTLDTGNESLKGTYGGYNFVNGRTLIKLNTNGTTSVDVQYILPDGIEKLNWKVAPLYHSGYELDKTEFTGESAKTGSNVKIDCKYTAVNSKEVVYEMIKDSTQLQKDAHYIIAQKGKDGKWYALSCNDVNTTPITVDETNNTVTILDKDIKNSPYIMKCTSVGLKTGKTNTYYVYKFQTNVKVPDTTSKYSLKIDKDAVTADYIGNFKGMFNKGGGEIIVSVTDATDSALAKSQIKTSNKSSNIVLSNGYFNYGAWAIPDTSYDLAIFTDAESEKEKLEYDVTVNFFDESTKVDSSVTTRAKFDLAKMDDIEKAGVKYTFVGWSTDANVKTFLDLSESCDLYDYNDDKDTASLKQAVKEKYSIIHTGNPDIVESINLFKDEELQKLIDANNVLNLYPVYAVRGYSQAVTSDDEDGVKIVGVSDWKMIQPDDTDYDKPDKEKWLGKIFVEVYKDGKLWGAPQPMYFRYHNDDAADLNLKFIDDAILGSDKYNNDLYKYLSDPDTYPATSQRGHYVIDAVYADQGGSEDGLKYKYNWLKNNGGQLDNVKGGSTVKVYVTTVYQVEYFLNDVELSDKPNNEADGGTWHDSGFYTTEATEEKFAEETSDYDVKIGNNYSALMDGSIKTAGVTFADEKMKRGEYSAFKYFINEYPHEFVLPILPESVVPEGEYLINSKWQMKDSTGKVLYEFDPETSYKVTVNNIINTWMDNDNVVRVDTHKDDIVNTYHLYVYTEKTTNPADEGDVEPTEDKDNGNDYERHVSVKDKDTGTVDTGDNSDMALYLSMITLLGAVFAMMALKKREEN